MPGIGRMSALDGYPGGNHICIDAMKIESERGQHHGTAVSQSGFRPAMICGLAH